MIIDCISDLHGFHPKLPGGDLLIIAGDITAGDTVKQWKEFYNWVKTLQYQQIVYIAGNHDGFLENVISSAEMRSLPLESDDKTPSNLEYLIDSSFIFEGLKIYGMPWTPTFFDWYFMRNPGKDMQEVVNKIPEDTDILITHGPAYGVWDKVQYHSRPGYYHHAGCKDLMVRLRALKQLKLHVFGHIHESPGFSQGDYASVNACIMDGNYNPTNWPVRVILEGKRVSQMEEIRLD